MLATFPIESMCFPFEKFVSLLLQFFLFNLSLSKTFNFVLFNRYKDFLSGKILRDHFVILVQLCDDFIGELVNRFMVLAGAGQWTSFRH